MADILHSARSGDDWTTNELLGFNIRIIAVDAVAFFGTTEFCLPQLDLAILNNAEKPPGPVSKAVRLFFNYMRDAMFPAPGTLATDTDDYATFLLSLLGYDEQERVIHRHRELEFVMCGQNVNAKPDICVTKDVYYLLLVHGDKRWLSADDPEPQLIADAIAAFAENNRRREASRLPPLTSMLLLGITITGTAPKLYKIPVTTELLTAISTGYYPVHETVVHKFTPPVPDPAHYYVDGMRPLVNRRAVLGYLEAFRRFIW